MKNFWQVFFNFYLMIISVSINYMFSEIMNTVFQVKHISKT